MSKRFLARGAGIASACTGIILIPFALDALLRYSPYGNPGALGIGLWLGAAAVALIAFPAAVALAVALARSARRYLAWRRTLTPGQRAALATAELAALAVGEEALRRHNREVSARLTKSVMGTERGDAA